MSLTITCNWKFRQAGWRAPSLSLPSLSSMWDVSTSSSNATNLENLILDLSSPAGHSVNDRIAGEDYSLQYMKLDGIIKAIMRLGRGSLMAKIILIWCAKCILHCASRYRGSLVVGYEMAWCLLCRYGPAFGIRSAPYIFTCIAGVGDQVKLQCRLPDALPRSWWLLHSWPSWLLCL